MALFDDVNRKLQALGNSVTAIGEAAKNKGAYIDPETTPLSEWAGAIDDIPLEAIEWKSNTSTGQLTSAVVRSELTFPTTDSQGNALSTTFAPSKDSIMKFGIGYCRKLIIPDYFIATSASNDSGWQEWTVVREIEIQSRGSVSWQYMRWLPRLQKVRCLTEGTFSLEVCTRFKEIESLDGATVIDIPNATSLATNIMGVDWSSGSVDTFIINAPKIKTLGRTSHTDFGQRWCGDNTFPEVTTLNSLRNPIFANYVNTLKLPKLTNISGYFMSQSGGEGKIVLYIGPNLSSIHGDTITRIINNIANGYLEIHIPSGESTTKTYLDNNGISYIQDYVL